MNELQAHRQRQARQMQNKLRQRIIDYAMQRRSEEKWKLRLYALSYGAGIRTLTNLGKDEKQNIDHLKHHWIEEAYQGGMYDALALLRHSDWLVKFLASIGLTQSFTTGGVLKSGRAFPHGGVVSGKHSYPMPGSGCEAIIPRSRLPKKEEK